LQRGQHLLADGATAPVRDMYADAKNGIGGVRAFGEARFSTQGEAASAEDPRTRPKMLQMHMFRSPPYVLRVLFDPTSDYK